MVTAALIGVVTEGQVCIFKAESQAPRDEAVIYIQQPKGPGPGQQARQGPASQGRFAPQNEVSPSSLLRLIGALSMGVQSCQLFKENPEI